MRPSYNGKPTGLEVVVLAVAGASFICLVFVAGSMRSARNMPPTADGIIFLEPADGPVGCMQEAIAAHGIDEPPGIVWALDPKVLKEFCCSLVIEAAQVTPAAIYYVHWAGVRTSGSRTDRSISAELTLHHEAISELTLTAGGRIAARQELQGRRNP